MTTQNTWTIGTFSNDEVRDVAAIYAHGRIRPIVYDISGATLDEADANTRLIAAAPDLLAALIETREALYEWANQSGISKSEHGHRSRVISECEAAIEKATA